MASTTRTPASGGMPHGSYQRYQKHGCRCPKCTQARKDYDRNRSRKTAYRQWTPWGDLAAVEQRLDDLVDAGWPKSEIAHAAGVDRRTIVLIYHRHQKQVTRETERKILAVPVQSWSGWKNSTGPMRMLRGLAVRGHNLDEVSEWTGLSRSYLAAIRSGLHPKLPARTEQRISAAYEQLRGRQPVMGKPSQTRQTALRAGWDPPEAWNRWTIGDPGAGPLDCGVPERTKNPPPVQPGQVYISNSPRGGPAIRVERVDTTGNSGFGHPSAWVVDATTGKRGRWVQLRTLYTDGIPRRSGYSLNLT